MISIKYFLFFSNVCLDFLGSLPKEKKASPGIMSFALSIICSPSIFIKHGPIPNTSNSWIP